MTFTAAPRSAARAWVCGSVAVLLSALAGVTAPPVAAQSAEFRALSDTRAVPTPAEAAVELRAIRSAVCPRGRTRTARRMGTRKAVRSAKRLLRRRVGRRGYKRFLRSRRARKPAVAQDLAVAAVAGKSPAAALAGFLAAHARQSRNPRHLLNASVMLTRLGKPREALALIAAAERLPAPKRMPMGIGVRALALNNRGFALIALRRFRQAERPLAKAARREPLLAEARLNLALARLCRGRVGAAVGPYVTGRRRRALSGGVETAAVQPPAGAALDLSFRRDAALPSIRLPAAPEDAAASAAGWKQAREQRYAEAGALFEQGLASLQEMGIDLASKPPLQANRALGILALWNERYRQRPDLKARQDAVLASRAPLEGAHGDWGREYDRIHGECQDSQPTSDEIRACVRSRCTPAFASAHSRWLPLMREAEQAAREWANELYRYASGLAANYASPLSQRALLVSARHEIVTLYASHVVLQIDAWTDTADLHKGECTQSGGEPEGEEGDPALPAPDLCPPGLRTVKISFSIGFAAFGANCEAISVDMSLPKPISPFVKVDYTFASGSTTVFAGAKGNGKIPGLASDLRAGMTFSFDSAGNMTDIGLRGQAEVAAPGLPGLPGTAPKVGGQLDYSLAGTLL